MIFERVRWLEKLLLSLEGNAKERKKGKGERKHGIVV
jgi:hypothetical protein